MLAPSTGPSRSVRCTAPPVIFNPLTSGLLKGLKITGGAVHLTDLDGPVEGASIDLGLAGRDPAAFQVSAPGRPQIRRRRVPRQGDAIGCEPRQGGARPPAYRRQS